MNMVSRKTLTRSAIALSVMLALYAIAGFFILPGYVKQKLIDGIAESTGRKATLGELTINPFELSATFNKFALYDKQQQVCLGVGKLYVNFQLRSLFNGTLTFSEISIEQPELNFTTFSDSSTNFSGMISESPKSEEKSEPRVLVIEKLSLNQGNIHYEDQTRSTPFVATLDSLSFSLNNFTTQPQENGLYSFDAQTAQGERLSWKGSIVVSPPRSAGSFALSGLQGRTLWEFMEERFNFEITQGALDVNGEYEFSMENDSPEFIIRNTSAHARSLALIDRTTKAPAASAAQVHVKGIEFGYKAHSVTIGDIIVDSASLYTTREKDGNYGLKTLLMPRPSKVQDSTTWGVLIHNIALTNSSCLLTDNNLNPPAQLLITPANFSLSHFRMDSRDTSMMKVQIGINNAGSVTLSGAITMKPITANLDIMCSGIRLQTFQPYVDEFAHLKLLSGELGVEGRTTYQEISATEALKTFTGSLSVTDFRGIDPVHEEDFLRWNKLDLKTISYSSKPARTTIDEISLLQPFLRVIIDSSRTTNFHHIMKEEDTTVAKPKVSAEQKMTTVIGGITVNDGSMNFADYSLLPNFSTGIYQLNGAIKELSSEQLSHASLDLQGRVDKYAPVTIKGEINPLSDEAFTDIIMKFQNIELTTFTPYSGKFAGYKIDKGKLTLDLHYKLNKKMLEAENKVIVDQLTLGEEVEGPDVTSLPVKLAIALLKDSHGVIDLDLPISGNLDDPEFSVFPIVMKVLVNLVTKAVTAPFNLLGNLFGGSGEDLSYLQFAPGSEKLPADQISKLENLSKALTERPSLLLDIRGLSADSVDRIAMTERTLMKKIRDSIAAIGNTSLTTAEEEKLLKLYSTTFSSSPESLVTANERAATTSQPEQHRKTIVQKAKAKLLSQIVITDQELRALAVNRAKTIKEHLINSYKVDESRIFILDAQSGASVIDGMIQIPLNLNAK